jgi:hypothetical protein
MNLCDRSCLLPSASRELELRHATAEPEQRGEQDEPDYSGGWGDWRSGLVAWQAGPACCCLQLVHAWLPQPPPQLHLLLIRPPPPLLPADIPNLETVKNPAGIAPVELPLTLRMLCHVPILVSSRRSQTSGSPTHVFAKLWLKAAQGELQQQPQLEAPAQQAQLREAAAQGIQESWD